MEDGVIHGLYIVGRGKDVGQREGEGRKKWERGEGGLYHMIRQEEELDRTYGTTSTASPDEGDTSGPTPQVPSIQPR